MTVSDLSADQRRGEGGRGRRAARRGRPARPVTLEALPGRPFAGRVVEVGASALPVDGPAPRPGSSACVVRLDRPDPGLRPGLTCDAEMLTGEQQNVLTVPLQAVVLRSRGRRQGARGVFVVRDGRGAPSRRSRPASSAAWTSKWRAPAPGTPVGRRALPGAPRAGRTARCFEAAGRRPGDGREMHGHARRPGRRARPSARRRAIDLRATRCAAPRRAGHGGGGRPRWRSS